MGGCGRRRCETEPQPSSIVVSSSATVDSSFHPRRAKDPHSRNPKQRTAPFTLSLITTSPPPAPWPPMNLPVSAPAALPTMLMPCATPPPPPLSPLLSSSYLIVVFNEPPPPPPPLLNEPPPPPPPLLLRCPHSCRRLFDCCIRNCRPIARRRNRIQRPRRHHRCPPPPPPLSCCARPSSSSSSPLVLLRAPPQSGCCHDGPVLRAPPRSGRRQDNGPTSRRIADILATAPRPPATPLWRQTCPRDCDDMGGNETPRWRRRGWASWATRGEARRATGEATGDREPATGDGEAATGERRRATSDGRAATGDGRWATGDGRRWRGDDGRH